MTEDVSVTTGYAQQLTEFFKSLPKHFVFLKEGKSYGSGPEEYVIDSPTIEIQHLDKIAEEMPYPSDIYVVLHQKTYDEECLFGHLSDKEPVLYAVDHRDPEQIILATFTKSETKSLTLRLKNITVLDVPANTTLDIKDLFYGYVTTALAREYFPSPSKVILTTDITDEWVDGRNPDIYEHRFNTAPRACVRPYRGLLQIDGNGTRAIYSMVRREPKMYLHTVRMSSDRKHVEYRSRKAPCYIVFRQARRYEDLTYSTISFVIKNTADIDMERRTYFVSKTAARERSFGSPVDIMCDKEETKIHTRAFRVIGANSPPNSYVVKALMHENDPFGVNISRQIKDRSDKFVYETIASIDFNNRGGDADGASVFKDVDDLTQMLVYSPDPNKHPLYDQNLNLRELVGELAVGRIVLVSLKQIEKSPHDKSVLDTMLSVNIDRRHKRQFISLTCPDKEGNKCPMTILCRRIDNVSYRYSYISAGEGTNWKTDTVDDGIALQIVGECGMFDADSAYITTYNNYYWRHVGETLWSLLRDKLIEHGLGDIGTTPIHPSIATEE